MNGKIKKYLIDTNIIIDQIRGFKTINDIFPNYKEDANIIIFISVITELEIYAGKSMNKTHSKNTADQLLNEMIKIPVNSQIAQYAGELKRNFSLNFPDSLIAATAILNKCTLITRNIKHFQKISKLKVLKPV